jgi:hypothetical protein
VVREHGQADRSLSSKSAETGVLESLIFMDDEVIGFRSTGRKSFTLD